MDGFRSGEFEIGCALISQEKWMRKENWTEMAYLTIPLMAYTLLLYGLLTMYVALHDS